MPSMVYTIIKVAEEMNYVYTGTETCSQLITFKLLTELHQAAGEIFLNYNFTKISSVKMANSYIGII